MNVYRRLLKSIVVATNLFGVAWAEVTLSHPGISEASGIAISQIEAGKFWVVNDSGNTPELFLVAADGQLLSSVTVGGVHNQDWEDLDSFTYEGRPYLLIADVGDNSARRATSSLILLPEPPVLAEGWDQRRVNAAVVLRFRYEDGPQDCEAVAVDPQQEKIVLIAKRSVPPSIYELPLQMDAPAGIATARRVGAVAGLPRPTAAEVLGSPLGPWRYQPTGLAVSSDGGLAAVVTYQGVFVYPRGPTQSWAETLSAVPVFMALPLAQFESVTFDSNNLLVLAEGRFAALRRLPLPGGGSM